MGRNKLLRRLFILSKSRYQDQKIQTYHHKDHKNWVVGILGVKKVIKDVRGTWEVEQKQNEQERRILDHVCVQHEIDHLNGITIHDRENKPQTHR